MGSVARMRCSILPAAPVARLALVVMLFPALAQAAGGSPPAPAAAPAGAIELRAAEVTVRDGGRVIEARGEVRITDGTHRVRADRAVYSVRERRIELAGNVIITSPEGTLEAARASILLTPGRRLDSVEAAGEVALKTRDRVLRASRVQYSVGGEALIASGSVSLSIPPDIIATGAQLRAGRGTATLSGPARIQHRDGFLEGDRVEVVEQDQVAYVRGGVRSVIGETTVTAEAATLYARDRKAVFRDNVRLTSPGRTLQATQVTVFYDGRRIVAEGETTIRLEPEPERPPP